MHARPHLDHGRTKPAPGLAAHLDDWAPEPVAMRDELSSGPAERLCALLDQPALPADTLPPLWHWLHFLEWPAQSGLGADGHPRDGQFLPPIPDRRRMIAGGRVEQRTPLELGVPATRVSRLQSAVVKQGRTGEMVFVTVRHEISQRSELRVVEDSDIVYRSGEDPRRRWGPVDTSSAPPGDAPWQLTLRPDPALLFRFSTLTANAHRIHYDQPYVTEVEGYPGLVVHGPLLALLLLELPRRLAAQRTVRSVSYRLRRPVFAGEHLAALGGEHGELRIATARDDRHAIAEVSFA